MGEERELALVTGASSGIGFELAKQCAEQGYDLLVNAEDSGLEPAAGRLAGTGTTVRSVRADLRSADGVEQLHGAVRATGRPVAVALLNAGVGQGGAFVDNALTDEMDVVDLNIRSTLHLAKLLLPDMVRRGAGKVLISSSVGAMVPGSYQAVYNASKSFLQSFAEAVQEELKDTGVTITSLMPGPTETNFFHRAGMDDTRIGRSTKDDPAEVAEQGLRALLAGRGKVVAGSMRTKAQAAAGHVVPDRAKAAAHRQLAGPGSGER
ncbi:SDR family NAD(P)-dependent oxidoreductase [Saccharopolyspora cebuensis]|uniref:SDR family NAD(P)-dependent oxidoreductase n=1 Tax=Saccharopolyspora cebuensis TaxID=418759 RepID=A0ABV4CDA1_9PSEU